MQFYKLGKELDEKRQLYIIQKNELTSWGREVFLLLVPLH